MTTEPNESKSGDASIALGAMATAEIEVSSPETSQNAAPQKSNKTRRTFVPPLDPTVGIELRVTRTGMPARRLRINATRCTFGSGEGCTVRLSDASLRPLHAVILRDNGRIMIRGYSVPLEINGKFVTESNLGLGDVVRLGQYCFEMIDLPASEADHDQYEDESIATTRNASHPDAFVNTKTAEPPKPRRSETTIATDEVSSSENLPSQKRLKFSQPTPTLRPNAPRGSVSQSVLDGLQISNGNVRVLGRGDEAGIDEQVIREPVTSLAQIHVQAKRNSELMAEVAAARQSEQEAQTKLAAVVQQLEGTQSEVVQATQTAVILKAEIASLNDQVLKLNSDAQEQQTIVLAEQSKLNRTIASLRETGAASQKAEAATRQALQEAIRQRDEALAQRAMAIDAQQLTRAKLDEAEAHLRRMNQEADEASNLLARLKSETEKARVRIDELKDVCCGQADQITKLSNSLEASQSSELAAVTRLKNTIDQLQMELDASRQRVRSADLERVQLNTLRTTLDSTLHEHISEKLAWSTQVDRLNQKLESISADLQSATNDLKRSRDESVTLKLQNSELHSQVANIESELSLRPTPEQLEDVRSQLAQSERDLENTERQLAQLREDYDQLASQKITQESANKDQADKQVVHDPGLPTQSQAFTSPLPSSLFPVPAISNPSADEDDELQVEATHVSNIQELVASAAEAFSSYHPQAESVPTNNPRAEKKRSSGPTDSHEQSLSASGLSGAAAWNRKESGHSQDSVGAVKPALSVDPDVKSQWHKPSSEPQGTTDREEPPVNQSTWNTPLSRASDAVSSDSWNTGHAQAAEKKPLQPLVSRDHQDHEPETQSQWLSSNRAHTEVMKADTAEESCHTEPLSGHLGVSFPTGDENFAAADDSACQFESATFAPPAVQSAPPISDSAANIFINERAAQDGPAEDDAEADEESLLAALIQRSEGPASSWFDDYSASQRAIAEASEPENPEDAEDAEDNLAVLARLSKYVNDNDASDDEIGQAIAESEHNGLDPEASALSLARMLINELDSVTQSDRDYKVGFAAPDPMVKSKRLVGTAVSEADASNKDEDDIEDDLSPQIEMRRKDFDERAFRESLADSADEDMIDPNADEAAYSSQSETGRPTGYAAAPSAQPVAEEEEDSVEAYMNQLLRRMGQEPLATTKPAEETAKPAASQFSAQPREAKREMQERVRPKRPAPELEVPMDQMRELANESAESAISTSNRKGAKEMRSRALVDGAQASVVVICAVVFFYCGITSSNLSLVWNTAGSLALALSAFFFYEMFRKLTASAKTA